MPLLSVLLGAAACALLLAIVLRHERRRSATQLDELLEARTSELSELSAHLQEFAEKERSEVAGNLHGELGGLLTAAKMDLSWLQSRSDQPPDAQRLAQMGDALDQAMTVKRRVVEQLRPSLLDHFGLATALRTHVEAACARAGLQFEGAIDEDLPTVPGPVAIALFRLVQEGLANSIRHAEARHVRLELRCDKRSYFLKLADDGRGFNMEGRAFRWSHGLSGMRQRIQSLHGQFKLRSSPGHGTQIEAEVPRPAL
jgi:signal transduction histidine kinase